MKPAGLSFKDGKPCVACGRPTTWRQRRARHWDEAKGCSDACRTGAPAQR